MENQPETLPHALRRIQNDWGMSDEQMARACHVPDEVYQGWIRQADEPLRYDMPSIPPGMATAAPLVSIHRNLSSWVPDPEEQAKWLLTGHKDFGGHKPMDVIASSPENQLWVGYYLESSL